jgi:aldehyde:ferredoxin oxidoreductase
MDTLDVCIFLVEPSRRMLTLQHMADLVNNITGWDTTLDELIRVAERGITLARLFNAKCGITKKDEDLPDRVFTPLPTGPIKGTAIDREAFLHAREMYYQMTGMDADGKPLEGRLLELEIEEHWKA